MNVLFVNTKGTCHVTQGSIGVYLMWHSPDCVESMHMVQGILVELNKLAYTDRLEMLSHADPTMDGHTKVNHTQNSVQRYQLNCVNTSSPQLIKAARSTAPHLILGNDLWD